MVTNFSSAIKHIFKFTLPVIIYFFLFEKFRSWIFDTSVLNKIICIIIVFIIHSKDYIYQIIFEWFDSLEKIPDMQSFFYKYYYRFFIVLFQLWLIIDIVLTYYNKFLTHDNRIINLFVAWMLFATINKFGIAAWWGTQGKYKKTDNL